MSKSLTTSTMSRVITNKLAIALQGTIIELVEEGYSEEIIKNYIREITENSLTFLEEYVAL